MTVKELKNQLNQYPDNTTIYIPDKNHNGWYTTHIFFDYSNYENRINGGLLYLK